jgi:hypothetical protein
VSCLAHLERDGTPLVSAAVARTDEDALGDEIQVNQGVGRSWTVPLRVILMVESGVVNVGYVFTFRGGLAMADSFAASVAPSVANPFA